MSGLNKKVLFDSRSLFIANVSLLTAVLGSLWTVDNLKKRARSFDSFFNEIVSAKLEENRISFRDVPGVRLPIIDRVLFEYKFTQFAKNRIIYRSLVRNHVPNIREKDVFYITKLGYNHKIAMKQTKSVLPEPMPQINITVSHEDTHMPGEYVMGVKVDKKEKRYEFYSNRY